MWAYFLLSVLIKNICVRLCMCMAVWCKEFPVQLESKGCLTPFLGYLNYPFGKTKAGSSWEICFPTDLKASLARSSRFPHKCKDMLHCYTKLESWPCSSKVQKDWVKVTVTQIIRDYIKSNKVKKWLGWAPGVGELSQQSHPAAAQSPALGWYNALHNVFLTKSLGKQGISFFHQRAAGLLCYIREVFAQF